MMLAVNTLPTSDSLEHSVGWTSTNIVSGWYCRASSTKFVQQATVWGVFPCAATVLDDTERPY